MKKDISILIPTFNPDGNLLPIVRDLQKLGNKIIVVNDGSDTRFLNDFNSLKESGITVLGHNKNLGKGCALKTGFEYYISSHPDGLGLITVDDDGQHCIADIIEIRNLLKEKPEAFILGCRNFSKAAVPFKNKLGNLITIKFFKLACGFSISDTQTGLRAIPLSFMKKIIKLPGKHFDFEMEMLINAKGMDIIEYPIKTIYFKYKKSHFNAIKDSFKILLALLKGRTIL